MKSVRKVIMIFPALVVFLCGTVHGERIKDIASIEGVRTNQLVG